MRRPGPRAALGRPPRRGCPQGGGRAGRGPGLGPPGHPPPQRGHSAHTPREVSERTGRPDEAKRSGPGAQPPLPPRFPVGRGGPARSSPPRPGLSCPVPSPPGHTPGRATASLLEAQGAAPSQRRLSSQSLEPPRGLSLPLSVSRRLRSGAPAPLGQPLQAHVRRGCWHGAEGGCPPQEQPRDGGVGCGGGLRIRPGG